MIEPQNKTQFYLGNQNIKKHGVIHEYTDEQVKEYIKCSNDTVYFTNKYYKMVTIDGGLEQIKLRDYQEKIITTVSENNYTIITAPRQSSKCVSEHTKISVRNKHTGEVLILSMSELYHTISSELTSF